jgi:hypothetical protein
MGRTHACASSTFLPALIGSRFSLDLAACKRQAERTELFAENMIKAEIKSYI